MNLNTFLIHTTRGRIGGKLGKQSILVMNVIGRKTGKVYRTPIAYFKVERGYYVIASNWGQEKNAAWYFNLRSQPDITIEVEGKEIHVHASEARGEENDALWQNAVDHHPDYLRYKGMTSRHIPIIVFEEK